MAENTLLGHILNLIKIKEEVGSSSVDKKLFYLILAKIIPKQYGSRLPLHLLPHIPSLQASFSHFL